MSTENPILDALQTSVIINRRDKSGQIAWTEWRAGIAYGCPANPGDLVGLNASGLIDPCLLPATASQVYVNGSAVPFGVDSPNFNNTLPAAPIGYTNVIWQFDGSGNISAAYATSGTVVSFGQITSGTNIMATMDVGTGASLSYSGTGVVNANEIGTINIDGNLPTHAGQLLISQPGNTTAVWADPLVQGLYPDGTPISTPINPVYIGGAGTDGELHGLKVTTTGEAIVIAQDQETDPNVLRFGATTGLTLVTNTTNILVPLLSISPKVGATTVTFTFRSLQGLSLGNVTHFQFLLNATLTGASFTNVDPASSMTRDSSAISYTGGRLLDSGFIAADSKRHNFEFVFGFTGGTPDTLTVVFAPVTGSAKSSVGCSMAWDEQTLPL